MPDIQVTTVGLLPALIVREQLRFGPLEIVPVESCDEAWTRELAEQYALHRGAHPSHQAVLRSHGDKDVVLRAAWSLFRVACVTFARRREHLSGAGVSAPENFYLVPAWPVSVGYGFDTGQTRGLGRPSDVPLRWPADEPRPLDCGQWDRTIELACSIISPSAFDRGERVSPIVASSELLCEALERRTELLQGKSSELRTFVLTWIAMETLARGRLGKELEATEIVKHTHRLCAGRLSLLDLVFDDEPKAHRGTSDGPSTSPGTKSSRLHFVAARLAYLRNRYTHALRDDSGHLFELPPEPNGRNTLHVATILLAALVGQDLLEALGVPPKCSGEARVAHLQRLGVQDDLILNAEVDGASLLRELETQITPVAELRTHCDRR